MPLLSKDLILPISNTQIENASYSKNEHPTISKPTPSVAPPAYSTTRTVTFATVSLHMTDRIRFLQFPDHDLPRLVDIVIGSWSNGIQGTRQYAGSFEIKLKGNPWEHCAPSSSGLEENKARRLIRRLLEGLYDLGWLFDASVRACKKPSEKDTMLFLKHENRPLPPPCEWLMISYDAPNILTIQCAPADLTETIRTRFGKWITKTSADDSCTRFTLKGHPWSPDGKDTVKVRSMLLIVRETLEMFRFGVCASLTMMSVGKKGETDVLVCNRRVDGEVEDECDRR